MDGKMLKKLQELNSNKLKEDYNRLLAFCKPPAVAFSNGSQDFYISKAWLNKLALVNCKTDAERTNCNRYLSHFWVCLELGKLYAPFKSFPPAELPKFDYGIFGPAWNEILSGSLGNLSFPQLLSIPRYLARERDPSRKVHKIWQPCPCLGPGAPTPTTTADDSLSLTSLDTSNSDTSTFYIERCSNGSRISKVMNKKRPLGFNESKVLDADKNLTLAEVRQHVEEVVAAVQAEFRKSQRPGVNEAVEFYLNTQYKKFMSQCVAQRLSVRVGSSKAFREHLLKKVIEDMEIFLKVSECKSTTECANCYRKHLLKKQARQNNLPFP